MTLLIVFSLFLFFSPLSTEIRMPGAQTPGEQTPGVPLPDEAVEEEIDTAPTSRTLDTLPEIDEWRDTLRFGINSAVVELLPRLTREKRIELAAEVGALFNTANDRQVLQGAAEYLRQLSRPEGHDRAVMLIHEYYDRSADLITTVLGYLRETDAPIDAETGEILKEISRLTPAARAVAAVRLYAAHTASTEDLIDLYREQGIPEDVKGQVLVEIGTRGDSRAFDFVAEVLGEDEEATTMLQRYAIDTLGKLGDEQAIPIILRQLESGDAMTRAYAVNALTNFNTVETNQALLTSLRDQFWRVRVAALKTVAERRMDDALPAVLYMMRRDPERPVRLEAINTVAALDQTEGWDVFLERMADPRGNVDERSAMIDVSLRTDAGRAVPVILDIVQAEWTRENSRILDTVGRTISVVEDRAVSPVVEQLLNHRSYIIQTYGARAAGLNSLSQYSEVLQTLREEGAHRLIRDAAAAALQQM